MSGYKVFGGHMKIPQLARKYSVDRIIVATESVQAEAWRRLNDYAGRYGLVIQRMRITVENLTDEFRRPARTGERNVNSTRPGVRIQ